MRFYPSKRHTFGSARFAGVQDLKKVGMLVGTGSQSIISSGLILGEIKSGIIHAPDYDHLLCMAPTKSGKTTCFVNGNVLKLGSEASVIVNDPNGEVYGVTKRERERHGNVYLWSPFSENSHSFNPLDFIRKGTIDEIDDVNLVVDLMMRDKVGGADPYWDREAKSLLMGLVIYVIHNRDKPLRTMAEVRHLLMLGEDAFGEVLKKMIYSEQGFVRGVGNTVLNYPKAQREGLIGSAKSHTSIWESQRLERVTAVSDFKFSNFKRSTATLYVVVPPEQLIHYQPALKLIFGLAIAECSRDQDNREKRVLIMLDEFANIGRLKPAETAISIARKSGVQLCLFIQDIAQIERVYGEAWKSFSANCRTKVYFNVNDIGEANRLSEAIGDITVNTRSTGNNAGLTDIVPDRLNQGSGEARRRLRTPDEIMAMAWDQCLIFQLGVRPILAKKLFYKSPHFAGLYDQWDGKAPSLEVLENTQDAEILALSHIINLPEIFDVSDNTSVDSSIDTSADTSISENAYWDEMAERESDQLAGENAGACFGASKPFYEPCESGVLIDVSPSPDCDQPVCLGSYRKKQRQEISSQVMRDVRRAG